MKDFTPFPVFELLLVVALVSGPALIWWFVHVKLSSRAKKEARLSFSARHSRRRNTQFAVRKVPAILSLTSHGSRLGRAHIAIETLLRQTVAPERLILWLSDKLQANELPEPLRRQASRGLEIHFVHDIGPYTKVIPALREFPGHPIVTVDDDSLYPRALLARLWAAYEAEPAYVHCHRAHYILFDERGRLRPYGDWRKCVDYVDEPCFRIFPTGVGGVLYPPGALHPDVLAEELFLEICPSNDDVWLKAMSLLNNVKCRRLKGPHREFPLVTNTASSGLMNTNVYSGRTDQQIQAVFGRYDLFSRLHVLPLLPRSRGLLNGVSE